MLAVTQLRALCGDLQVTVGCADEWMCGSREGSPLTAGAVAGVAVAARPLVLDLVGQSLTVCPGLPHWRHNLLSTRRCLSSGLSLPSGPSRFTMEFLLEDEGVVGVDEEAGFF